MEMDPKLGGRGIDTQYERDRIDYKPEIEYISEYEYTDGDPSQDDLIQATEVEVFLQYPPTKTIESISQTKEKYDRLIKLIETRLKDDVVTIDEDEYSEESRSEIISFCGSPRITFALYKDAVDKGNIHVIKAYEDAHRDITAKTEALIYRPILSSAIEIRELEKGFLRKASEAFGSSVIETYSDKEAQLAREWERAERRKRRSMSMLDELEFINSTAPTEETRDLYNKEVNSYREAASVYRDYSYNPLPMLSQMYYKRSRQLGNIADRTYSTLMYTVSDSFHGLIGLFVRRIVRPHLINESGFKQHLRETIKLCESLKYIIRLSVVSLSIDILSIGDVVLNTGKHLLHDILSDVTDEYGKMLRTWASPVLDFLDEVVIEDPMEAKMFPPFDRLASTVVGTIDGLERKFKDVIMSFYKVGLGSSMQNGQMLEELEKRKWLKDAYEVLDKISHELRNMLSMKSFSEFSVDTLVVSLISRNGWDVSYDPYTDRHVKIDSIFDNNF